MPHETDPGYKHNPLCRQGSLLCTWLFRTVTAYYRLALPFFVLLLYLLYLVWSYYWTLSSCRYLAVALEGGQEKIFVGESISWNLKIINKLWLFPLVRCGLNFSLPAQFNCCPSVPLEFAAAASDDNEFTSPDEILPTWKHGTLSYAWLPEKEEIKISLQMEALLRGVYYFPPLRSFVGDPSGLYHGLQELKQGQYVTVFPRLKNSMELMGALALTERERANNFGLEDPYEIQGVKDYQRTDSARSINWYATARTNSLKTNVYQRKDSQYCLVVLDLSVGYQPTYIPDRVRLEDPLLKEAISTAASLALYHLEEGGRTAFFTNAPLFKWDKKENPPRGSEGIYMQRQRRLTTLDFAGGTEQARAILQLCATIDETSRANLVEQERLWTKMKETATASTLIYLVCYHNPPASWQEKTVNNTQQVRDPANFYTPQRLGSLPSSRVRILNLSSGEGEIK